MTTTQQTIQISAETAQMIVELTFTRTMELLPKGDKPITESEFQRAQKLAILQMGYQPSVYNRKMKDLWDSKPWAFKAFEYMDELEDL